MNVGRNVKEGHPLLYCTKGGPGKMAIRDASGGWNGSGKYAQRAPAFVGGEVT